MPELQQEVDLVTTGFAAARKLRPKRSRWEILFSNHEPMPPPSRPDPRSWSDDTITAAWIGHATVLINFYGTTILTDPVFSQRAGLNILGIFTLGTKRLVVPALSIDELPPIDLILISHAHMDHLDLRSLRKFDRKIPVVMAANTSDVIGGMRFASVTEVDWGKSAGVAGVTVEGLRVKHFGWRFPWEKDRSRGNFDGRSFNGYLISKNGKHIVFGGDSAYQAHFKSLGERGIEIELAMMAIGAYDPWIGVHATPEEAVTMANHMGAKAIMPIHWGTFILSDEPTKEPIERIKAELRHHSPSLALEMVGETWKLPQQ
jgi:L-ascorbate metabolism protein UlaG (beta-lactamase superfamily)